MSIQFPFQVQQYMLTLVSKEKSEIDGRGISESVIYVPQYATASLKPQRN